MEDEKKIYRTWVRIGVYAGLAAFPTPPGEAGLVDSGPAAGLWYLVAALLILRSLKWFDDRLAETRGHLSEI